MKKFFPAIMFLCASALAGCCVHNGLRHPEPRMTIVDELKAETVALVHRDDDNDVMTFCAGVWVAEDKILTADHCARAPVEAAVESMATGDEDEGALEDMVQKLEDGSQIDFITAEESNGTWREPKASHKATVLFHDKAHDLALLTVKDPPKHRVAPVAGQAPAVGEELSVVGHPASLTWTYTKVMVSAYREENFRPVEKRGRLGPYMQVAGEVWKGNSGGGAYNANGELVGVASFMPPAPNECFFVHVDTIRAFLARRK